MRSLCSENVNNLSSCMLFCTKQAAHIISVVEMLFAKLLKHLLFYSLITNIPHFDSFSYTERTNFRLFRIEK